MSKPKASLIKRLWKEYVSKHMLLLLVAITLMVIEGSTMGLLSYSVKPLFDNIFVDKSANMIGLVAIGIFLIFTVRGLSAFGQRSITVTIGLRVITDIQKNIVRHLLGLDSSFYSRNPPGALIERVRGDSQALQSFASNALIVFGRDTFSLISLLSVALWVDWKWTLIAFIGTPLLVFPIRGLHILIRKTTRRARQSSADISNRLNEIFHGIKAIKLNNAEQHEHGRFAEEVRKYLKVQSHSEYGKAALPSMIDIIAGAGFVGVLIFGGQQIVNGDKTIGEFMSFFTALGLLFDPIRRLSGLGGNVQAAMASLERIYTLFDEQPTIVNAPAPKPVTNPQGDVCFNSVTFGYNNQPVLRGISFTAPAGKTTALVGPSGAGKTTIFNLLCRLEDVESGEILIGGQPLSEIDIVDLRNQISVVSQESALFDETIYDNIAFSRRSAEDDEIEIAAKVALVKEFSDLQSEGLQTLAGPRGSNLSGGQKQRVIIARALLRSAPILLLDEATSALDTRTEQKIQHALETAAKGKTTIVIAHRLSTVRSADIIHVIKDGQVIESGSHEQLIALDGAYKELNRTLEQ
ncbi:ABC transporter ATP-binding protein [Gynuella sp.]|uniref:ABC transporter ATP-binding protein n=1 Tax=Gynuella sp. TaxID=2969146 RepID=UPI003D0A6184